MSELKKISYEDLNIKLKELFESGITTYLECQGAIRSKYQLGNDRYAKQYKEAHKEWSELKKVIQDKVIQANDAERLNLAILSKNEALQILTEIAKGVKVEVDGNIIVPSPKDRCGAIAEMSRIEGWNAPTKVANTDSEGKDKPSQTIELPNGASIELS